MKKISRTKLIALFLCIMMILPMIFACGDKPAPSSTSDKVTESETTPPEENITEPAPTDPPETTPEPTTEEPTTEEPIEIGPIDPNLPYWEQVQLELSYYGLTNGVKIFAGDNEEAVMKKAGFGSGATKKKLELDGENVPFTSGYKVIINKEAADVLHDGKSWMLFDNKNVPTEEGDIIAGAIWVRGKRTGSSADFAATDPAQYFIAIRTPSDGFYSDGDIRPSGDQICNGEWQKVLFAAWVQNDDNNSEFNMHMGYGFQEFDVGGLIAYKFPWTPDNDKAASRIAK